ncbi:MAG: hypothetical protein ACRDUV_20310 [Pseudonocardiaceae bacterium]
MPYEWDEWAINALTAIEPHEVQQALAADRRWPRPAVDPSGLRVLTIWARTRAGRALIVAVYHSSGHTWKIIGAREMRADELAEFAKWEERDE